MRVVHTTSKPNLVQFNRHLDGPGNGILPNVKCAGDRVRTGEHEHVKRLCQDDCIRFGIRVSQLVDEGRNRMGGIRVLPVREDIRFSRLGAEVKRKVTSFPFSILDEIHCHY